MNRLRPCLAGALLVTSLAGAAAAPNIPPGELPGRERYRFQETPLDRFMQPGTPKNTQPAWRWDCDEPKRKRGKKKRRAQDGC